MKLWTSYWFCISGCNYWKSRSQWPHGLRRRSTAARLLRSWVRIPQGAWVFVCCECCVLSGRGLCDELTTRPQESHRLWCVVVCDLETSRRGGHGPRWAAAPQEKISGRFPWNEKLYSWAYNQFSWCFCSLQFTKVEECHRTHTSSSDCDFPNFNNEILQINTIQECWQFSSRFYPRHTERKLSDLLILRCNKLQF